ncbi:hypothetical protein UK23_31055 [Lentzea aerocolonigenes]|uniref:Tachylectin 2 domain-containing protein n=1 Tax=Lentzea aerocolonigenes TaxID=68170 RepID=A0A0F0GKE2_LENAE|nr:hypothetical protein [Lentzea aerocolonigenes]KJK43989.1 hypothetical protein UK23_31055 [Lentzea aerocolonigenes]
MLLWASVATLLAMSGKAHADPGSYTGTEGHTTLDKFQVTGWGGVFHTSLTDGVWSRYGYIQEQAHEWQDVVSIASARDGADDLHLLATTRDGRLLHVLGDDQGWSGFGTVAGYNGGAADPGPHPGLEIGTTAAAIDENGDLEVLATVAGGHHVVHTTRYARALDWEQLHSINDEVGWRGAVRKIGLARSAARMNMFAVTDDGNVYYSYRNLGERTWAPFYNIKWQCGEPGPVTDVSAVASGDAVHFMAIASGRLWHCGATPDAWSDFVEVPLPSGVSPASVDLTTDHPGLRATITGADGTVHDAVSTGQVFGAIWSPFAKVLNDAAPGPFVDVSAVG